MPFKSMKFSFDTFIFRLFSRIISESFDQNMRWEIYLFDKSIHVLFYAHSKHYFIPICTSES